MTKDQRTAAKGVTMQHRHFAFIASVIARQEDVGMRIHMAQEFARECATTNPKFDRERFLYAALGYTTLSAATAAMVDGRTLLDKVTCNE